MPLSLHELRERLSALDRPHQNTRYPQEIKALVVDHTRERLAKGEGVKPIAQSLGLCAATLHSWLSAENRTEASPSDVSNDSAVLLPVRVSSPVRALLPDDSGNGLVLVTPGGYRVEGLDVSTVNGLLERLP